MRQLLVGTTTTTATGIAETTAAAAIYTQNIERYKGSQGKSTCVYEFKFEN